MMYIRKSSQFIHQLDHATDLCDEPYWSRFHVSGPPPQPSIHVISDGKIQLCS